MKALITADVFLKFFLEFLNEECTNDFDELIENADLYQIQLYATNKCLNDVYLHFSRIKGIAWAEEIYSQAIKIIANRILVITDELKEEAHSTSLSNLNSTLDLVCAKANNLDLIITENLKFFDAFKFPAFLVDQLLIRLSIERSFRLDSSKISQFKSQINKSFYQENTGQWCLFHPLEVQRQLIYKIRYSAHSVIKVFEVIKAQGNQGITIEDLSRKTKFSKQTIKSLYWDLANFHLAFLQNYRIFPQPCLIKMGNHEIKEYLKEILEKHEVLQAIYKRIESSQCQAITKWSLPEFINNKCFNKKTLVIGSKSSMDYTSRMLSWFFYTNLLQEKDNGTIVKPSKINQQNSYLNKQFEQLKLFDSIDLSLLP